MRRRGALVAVVVAGLSGVLILTGMRSAGSPDPTPAEPVAAEVRALRAPTETTERRAATDGDAGTDLAVFGARLLAEGARAGLEGSGAGTTTTPLFDPDDEATLAVGLLARFPAASGASATPDLPVPMAAPTTPYFDEELVDLGRISIPALGVERTLHQGISLHNIDRGPSHWPGTASPGGIGNVVIAGHRTTHGAPFRDIDRLARGDEVTLTTGGVEHTYVVVDNEVVTPDGLHIVEQTPERTATLFACHPPGSAAFRFVVHLVLESSESLIPAGMQ